MFRRIAQASRLLPPGIVAVWSAGIVVAPVVAQQTAEEPRTEFAFKVARARSDNILRDEANGQSGSFTAAGFIAGFERDGTRFDAVLDADVEQREYTLDSIEDDLFGTLDGRIDFAFVPERFFWYAEENLGQTRVDPFAPDSPDNREQIKNFTTGPRLTLPLGMRSSIELGAARSKVSYDETSLLDRDSDLLNMAVVRTLANQARLSVVLTQREIDYERPDLDAELAAGYVRYDRELATGSAGLALGSNRVEFAGRESSEPFMELGWTREVGSFSRVTLTAANRLVDASESFRQMSPEDRLDSVLASADIYENSLLGLVYAVERPRSSLAFGFSSEEQAYETDTDLDNDQTRFDITYTRRMSGSLALSVGVYTGEREFKQSGQVDDDEGALLGLSKLFGTKFELDLSYRHESREGFFFSSYDENIVRLEFRYHLSDRPASSLGVPGND